MPVMFSCSCSVEAVEVARAERVERPVAGEEQVELTAAGDGVEVVLRDRLDVDLDADRLQLCGERARRRLPERIVPREV